MPPSSDFYNDVGGEDLQVATVANSKSYNDEDFTKLSNGTHFTLFSSGHEKLKHWEELRNCKLDDVNLWCDIDFLLVGVLFDAGLGSTNQKLALKLT